MKGKDEQEWMFQAEYDLTVAESNFKNKHYIYAIFMCHLSIEKALKAVYCLKLQKEPPKTHNLSQLAQILNLAIPDDLIDFVGALSSMCVPSRYPADMKRMLEKYDKKQTQDIMIKSRKVLKWVKSQLKEK